MKWDKDDFDEYCILLKEEMEKVEVWFNFKIEEVILLKELLD